MVNVNSCKMNVKGVAEVVAPAGFNRTISLCFAYAVVSRAECFSPALTI